MIWQLACVDTALIEAFKSVGEPDQSVIDRYMAEHGQRGPQKHAGIRRWYYLHSDNPRIRLATLAMPLEAWQGEAKIMVGTGEIIGEFEGNKEYVGQMGLVLQMQPIAWLQGEANKQFPNGSEMLSAISEQVLDRKAIERTQARIAQRYHHPSQRKKH